MHQAKNHLMSELTSENILNELFSRFSSRYVTKVHGSANPSSLSITFSSNSYESILQLQVDLLCDEFWTQEVRESLRPKIDEIARGQLPHASAALTLLLLKIPLT